MHFCSTQVLSSARGRAQDKRGWCCPGHAAPSGHSMGGAPTAVQGSVTEFTDSRFLLRILLCIGQGGQGYAMVTNILQISGA